MDRTHTWLCFNSFLNSDNSSRRTATKDVLYFSLSKRNIESFTFNHSQWQKNCSTFLFLLLTSLAIRIQSTNMFLFQWECLSKRASPSECVAVNLLISFFFFLFRTRHTHPSIVALLVFCPSPRDIITLRQREYSRSVCMYSVKDALWICTV